MIKGGFSVTIELDQASELRVKKVFRSLLGEINKEGKNEESKKMGNSFSRCHVVYYGAGRMWEKKDPAGTETTTTEGDAGEKKKVGFAIKTQDSPYFVALVSAVEEYSKKTVGT